MGLDTTTAQTLCKAKSITLVLALLGSMALFATLAMPWSMVRDVPQTLSFGFAAAWLTAALLIVVGCRWLDQNKAIMAAGTVALVMRAAMVLMVDGSVPTSVDPGAYQSLAMSLAHGHGLNTSLIETYGSVQAVFPPLYPLLLAPIVLLLGNNIAAPFVLNLLIDLATAWGIVALMREAKGTSALGRAQLAVPFIYLIWPTVLIGSIWAQKEGLACLLIVSLVRLAFRLKQHPEKGVRIAALMGIVAGLLALTQPALSLLPIAFYLSATWRFPMTKMVRFAAIATICGVVVLIPWWVRNFLIFGQFVPLTSGNGYSLTMLTRATWPLPPEVMELPELSRTAYATQQSVELIKVAPLAFVIQQVKNFFVNLFIDTPVLLSFNYLRVPLSFDVKALCLTLQLAPPILWISVFLATRRKLADPSIRWLAIVLLASVADLALFNSLLEFGPRHRLFLVPIALALIASALSLRQSEGGDSELAIQ